MNKLISTLAVFGLILTLTGCGAPKDDIAFCKQECEKAMNSDQKKFCLSACETAKEFSEKMGEVPVNDIVNDFNNDIYGNMNEAQKLKMKALQDAGQIPTNITPPSNPEDWEPNDDGFGDGGGEAECAGAFCE